MSESIRAISEKGTSQVGKVELLEEKTFLIKPINLKHSSHSPHLCFKAQISVLPLNKITSLSQQ